MSDSEGALTNSAISIIEATQKVCPLCHEEQPLKDFINDDSIFKHCLGIREVDCNKGHNDNSIGRLRQHHTAYVNKMRDMGVFHSPDKYA